MRKQETEICGFTLIELLIAIAIFSTVISAVYGAFRVSFHNISSTEDRLHYSLVAQRAYQCISNDLLYMVDNDDSNLVAEFISGTAKREFTLGFITSNTLVTTPATLQKTIQRITYSTEYDNETEHIALYRNFIDSKFNSKDRDSEKWLVANNLTNIRFSFYDAAGNKSDEWCATDEKRGGHYKYPNLIHIDFIFPARDKTSEPLQISTAIALSSEVQK